MGLKGFGNNEIEIPDSKVKYYEQNNLENNAFYMQKYNKYKELKNK